jgi:cyclopropane fatty-acyl-phospholipid synthase-like methyltransferase
VTDSFDLLQLAAGGDHVMDVGGCGSGGPTLFLAREHVCQVTGWT